MLCALAWISAATQCVEHIGDSVAGRRRRLYELVRGPLDMIGTKGIAPTEFHIIMPLGSLLQPQ